MNKHKFSKTMRESWKLKELAYEEVAHLTLEEALKKRIDDSVSTAKNFADKNGKRHGARNVKF